MGSEMCIRDSRSTVERGTVGKLQFILVGLRVLAAVWSPLQRLIQRCPLSIVQHRCYRHYTAQHMTCVTWIVVEIVTLELVAVMRHSVEV